ncbi:hypothetical protein Bbelb_187780 [Branchiostoma belcheri]|nr:hypothetical protein Bbelb_187780 [Branchiostoma belcheri]
MRRQRHTTAAFRSWTWSALWRPECEGLQQGREEQKKLHPGQLLSKAHTNLPGSNRSGSGQIGGVHVEGVQPGRRLKKIVLRQGQYCLERQGNKRAVFYPLEPQPQEGNVVVVRRYYSRLARDERYEKRVSWLENPTVATRQVACIGIQEILSRRCPPPMETANPRELLTSVCDPTLLRT